MKKMLKKLNLFSWLMLLLYLLSCVFPMYTTISQSNGEDSISSIAIMLLTVTVLCILVSLVINLLFRLVTCKLKNEYRKRNKQLALNIIPLVAILIAIGFIFFASYSLSHDVHPIDTSLLNGNFDSYVLISLVSLAIPVVLNVTLLGYCMIATRPLQQEHKAIIMEKRIIRREEKNAKIAKFKEEKAIILQEKKRTREKNIAEKEAMKNKLRLEKIEECKKQKLIDNAKAIEKKNNKEIILSEKKEMKKTNNQLFLDNFNKNYYHSFVCKIQKISIFVSVAVTPFFTFFLTERFLYDSIIELFERRQLIWTSAYILFFLIFVISYICMFVFSVIRNKEKIRLYKYYLDNREKIEATIDEKTRYRMMREYIDVNGFYYTNNSKTKIKYAYKTVTIIYAVLYIVSILAFIFIPIEKVPYIKSSFNFNYVLSFLAEFNVAIILSIAYFTLTIKRITNVKLYSEIKNARITDAEVVVAFDDKYINYIKNEKTGRLNKRAIKLGKAKTYLKYFFSTFSDAILIGIPFILLIILAMLVAMAITLAVSLLGIGGNSGSSSSNNDSDSSKDEDTRINKSSAFMFERRGRLDDEGFANYFIGESGREYKIYHYHRTSGYFEDENRNIYYKKMNGEFVSTGLYRKDGESEYEADERAKNSL